MVGEEAKWWLFGLSLGVKAKIKTRYVLSSLWTLSQPKGVKNYYNRKHHSVTFQSIARNIYGSSKYLMRRGEGVKLCYNYHVNAEHRRPLACLLCHCWRADGSKRGVQLELLSIQMLNCVIKLDILLVMNLTQTFCEFQPWCLCWQQSREHIINIHVPRDYILYPDYLITQSPFHSDGDLNKTSTRENFSKLSN